MLAEALTRGEVPSLDYGCKPLYCPLRCSFLPFICSVCDFDDRFEIDACLCCGALDCPALVVLFKHGVIDETAGNISKADRPLGLESGATLYAQIWHVGTGDGQLWGSLLSG